MAAELTGYDAIALGDLIRKGEISPVELLETTIQRFSRKIARWYSEGGYDLLLSPTMRIPPTKLGAFEPSP